jgi:excisionase family DNA binding protein
MSTIQKKKPVATVAVTDVLTLKEAAAYLRVSADELKKLAEAGGVPARPIGKEWRFSGTALEEWLRGEFMSRAEFGELEKALRERLNGKPKPPLGSYERISKYAGMWKDDEKELEEFLKEVYRRRGRPMVEERK